MRKRSFLTAGTLALVVCFGACNKETTPGPDVWATVNGKEIKRDEVEKYYRSRTNPEGTEPSQEDEEDPLAVRVAPDPVAQVGRDPRLELVAHALHLPEAGDGAVVREEPRAVDEGVGVLGGHGPHARVAHVGRGLLWGIETNNMRSHAGSIGVAAASSAKGTVRLVAMT